LRTIIVLNFISAGAPRQSPPGVLIAPPQIPCLKVKGLISNKKGKKREKIDGKGGKGSEGKEREVRAGKAT